MNNPIEIEAFVAAPVAQAWEAYTLPEHITQWNFASPEWCCPHASNDLRPGGRYLARMEARDGTMGFDFEGIYTDVEMGKHLAYTLGDDRKVTVTFLPEGPRTRVKVVFEAENMNSRELQQQGWQAILDNYAAFASRA